MVRIYIEAGSFYGKRSGVGRYSLSLCTALSKLRPGDQFAWFSFLRFGRKPAIDFPLPSNTHSVYIRWFPGRAFSVLMRYGISLPLELFTAWRADVVIFPNFIAWASLLHKKRISIVHDIAFEFYPEFIQAKNLAYLRRQLQHSLKRSVRIVAVSNATKQDIVRMYDVAPEKVSVIPNAIDHRIFNVKSGSRTSLTRNKFSIPEKYLLFAGNLEPRKNLVGLLKAYAESYSSHKLALVITGAKGWNDSAITQQFTELEHLPIIRTEFVSDEELAALYTGATAFVFPSFYEGFGIPCLEAMACGCPVITSNTSSLPEVVGDAGILVNPTDIHALAAAITNLVHDTKLHASLRQKGLKRARQFSWERSASALSAVVNEVIG